MKLLLDKKKFTLIEILLVIAIISILAALLLPVLNKGRTRARVISNVSNLKNIGIAATMYAQDYDNVFPSDMSQLTSKYIYAEAKNSFNGNPFTISDTSITTDSPSTSKFIVDTSISGFTNTLYADGHVASK